jgi:hypothetical protein
MKFEVKPFLTVILASIFLCLCFGAAILSPIDVGVGIKPPDTDQQANLDAYNFEALRAGQVGIFEVDLKLEVLPPSSSQEERALTVQPFADTYVYVNDDSDTLDPVEVCIDWLDLIATSEPAADGTFTYDIHNFLSEGWCHTIDPDKDYLYSGEFYGTTENFTVDNYYWIKMPKDLLNPYHGDLPEIVGQNFWFPYDNFKADINIQVATSVRLSNDEWVYAQVPAYYDWRMRPSGSRAWDIDMQNTAETLAENRDVPFDYFYEGAYQNVALTFERPLMFKISFPMLIIAMVFLIAFVPMMKDAHIEDILAVMAGLLFATFAIRAILSPGQEIGQTLIDIGIIGLTILEIIAAGLLFLRISRRKYQAHRQEEEPPAPPV